MTPNGARKIYSAVVIGMSYAMRAGFSGSSKVIAEPGDLPRLEWIFFCVDDVDVNMLHFVMTVVLLHLDPVV